ncbi:hypothetical protein M9Y30_06805 [Providencia thailandensis]|uniref:hypothetical protein n=1 Tax=Providencia stuartii TaxID=588 RepID=UPI002023483F|nr:hypothetical protein [Providencia thailandensis]
MYRALWALLRPYRFVLIFAVILQAIAGISSLIPWVQLAKSPYPLLNKGTLGSLLHLLAESYGSFAKHLPYT